MRFPRTFSGVLLGSVLLFALTIRSGAQSAAVQITASPSTITAGQSSTLTTTVQVTGPAGLFSLSHDDIVTPAATTIYQASVGTELATATVNVTFPAPPPSSSGCVVADPTQVLDTLPAGCWYEVPNSRLDLSGQLPVPKPLGSSGYPSIMTAWSGAVYDTKRDRLLVTGGGHGDYAGNEIYEFPLATLQWHRIWGPTPNDQIQPQPAAPGPTYLNGDPRQVHTYNGILYLPTQDVFWRHGGSVWSGSGGFVPNTWTFDLTTATWQQKADFSGPYTPNCARDVQTDHVFCNLYALFWEYDPATDTATKRSLQSAGYSPTGSTAIDQNTRQFVFTGDGKSFSYKLDTYPAPLVIHTTTNTGATEVMTANAKRPAMAYDSLAKSLVLWNGGTAVYTVDTSGPVWNFTKHEADPANTVTPSAPTSAGIFGRFQYIEKYNLYVLVNSISSSVYLYRYLPTPIQTAPATSQPTTTSQIALSIDGTWRAFPLSDVQYAKGSIPGTTKHISPGYNPSDGRIYLTAGDYSVAGTGASSSYRQETWSLSLKDRASAPDDPTAGWRLEYPYCGTGLQPKWPDFGGFHWDAGRKLFWWVAGVSEVNISAPCAGETPDKVDNPHFSVGHVMTYDPATKVWANAGPKGPAFTKVWDTVYDAAADRLVTVRQGSSSGDVYVDLYDAKSSTWSKQHVFAQPAITRTLYGLRGYGALDPITRTLYYIEAVYGHLMALDLSAMTLADLGPVPHTAPIGSQPKVVWDSTHKVLYWHNHAPGEFFAYHPDTKQWETLSTKSTLAGIEACDAMVMVYDPGQDALVAFGDVWSAAGTPNALARPYMFLYRYSK